MRLELHKVKIQDVQFGDNTRIDDGVLYVNRKELQELLQADKRLGRVEIELARPGERCRVVQVADVIEPRSKIGSQGSFGFAEKYTTLGEGETSVLQGVAIILSDCRGKGEATISGESHGNIIDMAGPGSEVSPFGQTLNVVLLPQPKDRVSGMDYQAALKMAGLRAATYLARAGENLKPDEIEIYDLPPLTEVMKGIETLPKITYIFQILSLQFEPIPGEPTLFGKQAEGMIPTIVHPNQVLDGAITSAAPGLNVQTYQIQNHPMIKELHRRHGTELCFAGVILTVAHNNVADFDRMADISASLAKWVIGADGAILTKTGGGAPELAMARTAQRCEQLGVKTAIAMLHMGADFKDAKYGAATIFSMPEVDAIVSMGVPYTELTLPPVEKVIGGLRSLSEDLTAKGEMVQWMGSIRGSLCQLGSSKLTAVRY